MAYATSSNTRIFDYHTRVKDSSHTDLDIFIWSLQLAQKIQE